MWRILSSNLKTESFDSSPFIITYLKFILDLLKQFPALLFKEMWKYTQNHCAYHYSCDPADYHDPV